ncbi:MAG: hypothetical protein ISS53_05110 [Dehalococcoidia bacterium]|nr:hypothetical protein [Dehalococcoidia bacterium]
MTSWTAGLIVTGDIVCDGCAKVMRHPERYCYVCEEGEPPLRVCEDCSRAKGYLKGKWDEKGRYSESFL